MVIISSGIQIVLIVMGFLYKKYPYTAPVKKSDRIKPGKKTPFPKKNIPKQDAIAAIMPALSGPYIMENKAIGIKPKVI